MNILSYISGFVDGEGCFCVSFQPSKRHRFGWEVRPSFSVSQNQDRAKVLFLMEQHFSCGSIRPDRSDKTLKYEVRSISDLVGKIIPHFVEHPLLSEKQSDFEIFKEVCEQINCKQHLEKQGFIEIVQVATKMNITGKQKYSGSDILSSLLSDEGIVCATG